MSNEYERIEDAIARQESSGWRWLTTIGGALVYVAVVAYAEVRGWSLLTASMDQSLLAIAAVGVVALGVTALLLPIFIHRVAEHGPQRTWATVFYIGDLAALATNAILDAARHSGTVNNDFLQLWGTWAVPALPLAVGLGWSLIWLTDPAQRERDAERKMIAAVRGSMHRQMMRAADAEGVRAAIESAAARSADALVGRALGVRVLPSGNGRKAELVKLESESEGAAVASGPKSRKR